MKHKGSIILESKGLILRQLKESDAQEVFNNWTNDDEVSKYMRWTTHKSVEETKAWLREEEKNCKNKDYYTWGIVLKQTGELIGSIAAFLRPEEDNRYEVGYGIGKKYWRNGYVTESLKCVMAYLINDVGIKKFKCAHAKLNPASGAVMQKVGFKYVRDDYYETFDGTKKYECKVYHLNIDKIQLVKPTKEYEKQALEYIEEYYKNGEKEIHACSRLDKTDNYSHWLGELENNSKKETVNKEWTISSTFFGVSQSDKEIVGMIDIRHELTNDFLRNYAGNIGYSVRPTQRRKGYASQMLKQGLKYCIDELKLNKVMISCDKENEASRRTILKFGGELQREYTTEQGELVQVFWINL